MPSGYCHMTRTNILVIIKFLKDETPERLPSKDP